MSLGIRVFVFALVLAGSLGAITVGQVDTFEDGTTMGWFVPGASPNPPANEPDGGPTGAGDAFLRLVAIGGGGPGSRLAVLNEDQWTGNYLATGVSAIEMDVFNFGPDELHLRLLFEDFPNVPGPPDNLALSAGAIVVGPGSGWVTVRFPVTPADLVSGGLGTVIGALSDVDTLRIFHNPAPEFPGPGVGIPVVTATLGVDNITAAIPEPGVMSLVTGGLLALLARRRMTSRRSNS